MLDIGVSEEPESPAPVSLEQPAASRGGTVRQRTLKTAIDCAGIGLHSGRRVAMTLRPAAADTGIVFRRTDVAAESAVIRSHWSAVCDTRLNTCLGNADGVVIRTVEHLLAALAGMGVDNAFVDIDGPEVPVMDGSAQPFVFLIECAGTREQDAPRRAIRVLKRISVRDGDRVATLTPGSGLSLLLEIDFAASAIRRQEYFIDLDPGSFKSELARARTFGFEQEVVAMRSAGLGLGGSLENAVVIAGDGRRVLNEDGLRYTDEFVRHKALDAVGDLSLAGATLVGHFHGVRSGHEMNCRLLEALFADEDAWALTTLPAGAPRPTAGSLLHHAAAAPVR